jgi:predicted aspartyl protease
MGLTFAEVEIVGRSYKALIDAGFNGEVLVSRRVAEEVGLKPFRTKERVTVDGRRIRRWRWQSSSCGGRRLRFL